MPQHEAFTPVIPVTVRTIAYFATVAASAATLAIVGLAPVWLDEALSSQVSTTATVIGAAITFIGGALGVAYRPTK